MLPHTCPADPSALLHLGACLRTWQEATWTVGLRLLVEVSCLAKWV